TYTPLYSGDRLGTVGTSFLDPSVAPYAPVIRPLPIPLPSRRLQTPGYAVCRYLVLSRNLDAQACQNLRNGNATAWRTCWRVGFRRRILFNLHLPYVLRIPAARLLGGLLNYRRILQPPALPGTVAEHCLCP